MLVAASYDRKSWIAGIHNFFACFLIALFQIGLIKWSFFVGVAIPYALLYWWCGWGLIQDYRAWKQDGKPFVAALFVFFGLLFLAPSILMFTPSLGIAKLYFALSPANQAIVVIVSEVVVVLAAIIGFFVLKVGERKRELQAQMENIAYNQYSLLKTKEKRPCEKYQLWDKCLGHDWYQQTYKRRHDWPPISVISAKELQVLVEVFTSKNKWDCLGDHDSWCAFFRDSIKDRINLISYLLEMVDLRPEEQSVASEEEWVLRVFGADYAKRAECVLELLKKLLAQIQFKSEAEWGDLLQNPEKLKAAAKKHLNELKGLVAYPREDEVSILRILDKLGEATATTRYVDPSDRDLSELKDLPKYPGQREVSLPRMRDKLEDLAYASAYVTSPYDKHLLLYQTNIVLNRAQSQRWPVATDRARAALALFYLHLYAPLASNEQYQLSSEEAQYLEKTLGYLKGISSPHNLLPVQALRIAEYFLLSGPDWIKAKVKDQANDEVAGLNLFYEYKGLIFLNAAARSRVGEEGRLARTLLLSHLSRLLPLEYSLISLQKTSNAVLATARILEYGMDDGGREEKVSAQEIGSLDEEESQAFSGRPAIQEEIERREIDHFLKTVKPHYDKIIRTLEQKIPDRIKVMDWRRIPADATSNTSDLGVTAASWGNERTPLLSHPHHNNIRAENGWYPHFNYNPAGTPPRQPQSRPGRGLGLLLSRSSVESVPSTPTAGSPFASPPRSRSGSSVELQGSGISAFS